MEEESASLFGSRIEEFNLDVESSRAYKSMVQSIRVIAVTSWEEKGCQ